MNSNYVKFICVKFYYGRQPSAHDIRSKYMTGTGNRLIASFLYLFKNKYSVTAGFRN